MIQTEDFINLFGKDKKIENIRFATVDSNYTSGRPNLVFDGEQTASFKKYPYLSSYTPAANDRVMIIKGVVIGKII